MEVEELLNLKVDKGPPMKFFEAKNPAMTALVCSQFEEAVAFLDNTKICSEIDLLQQFYVKYRNAHRHFLHFKTLSMFRRKLRHLKSSPPATVVRNAARHWKMPQKERHLCPSRQMFDFSLVAWVQLAFDVFVVLRIGEKCYLRCKRQSFLGHFSKLNFVFMSIVARLSLHCQRFSEFLSGTYKALLQARKLLHGLKNEWIPSHIKFPDSLDFDELSMKCATALLCPEEIAKPAVIAASALAADEAGVMTQPQAQGPADFATLLWANTEYADAKSEEQKPQERSENELCSGNVTCRLRDDERGPLRAKVESSDSACALELPFEQPVSSKKKRKKKKRFGPVADPPEVLTPPESLPENEQLPFASESKNKKKKKKRKRKSDAYEVPFKYKRI